MTSLRVKFRKRIENLSKENIRSKLSIIFLVFIIALKLSKIQIKPRLNDHLWETYYVSKPILIWQFANMNFPVCWKWPFCDNFGSIMSICISCDFDSLFLEFFRRVKIWNWGTRQGLISFTKMWRSWVSLKWRHYDVIVTSQWPYFIQLSNLET